jgi:hypothetical protein
MSAGPSGGQHGMATVVSHMSMSLDGYVAGPDQSQEHPIGLGGLALHQWLLPRLGADHRHRPEQRH